MSDLPMGSDGWVRPGPVRVFYATAWRTWLATIVGGALCGLFVGGPASLALFAFVLLGGAYLGFYLGMPLALGLGLWFAGWARPPASADRFVATIEGIGAGIALLVGVPINVVAIVMMGAPLHESSGWMVANPTIVLLALFAAGSIAMCETVGRTCGHLVAAGHLNRLGMDPPARRPLWTWPHDPHPGRVWHHLRTPRPIPPVRSPVRCRSRSATRRAGSTDERTTSNRWCEPSIGDRSPR